MRKPGITLVCLLYALSLSAQNNQAPARLAIISESPDTAATVDVLTAGFSKNERVQLLERNEIEKVYHEQGLSPVNKDYLKLGQILGADGLLLMETAGEGTSRVLNTRLIAVKPGVVLTAEKITWPLPDIAGWSALFAKRLNPLLPKLAVLAKDAIPISVVNLRSAIQSDEAKETERQLKLLAIQRLSQEPQLFVLERQQMQLLTGEKELQSDQSAFWNGRYLLEGVVDQNGYAKDTVTVNARLTPPKGGAPVLIEVSSPRANLAEAINHLAAKVTEALKVSPAGKEWNAADEARQYFDEANWALRWKIYTEARSAAESAWALGKRDMDGAATRIKAYSSAIGGMKIEFEDVDRASVDSLKDSDREWVLKHVTNTSASYPGIIFQLGGDGIHSVIIDNSPEPQSLDDAIRALSLYREFSQTVRPDELKPGSAWYELGVANLTVAAKVLQHFYLVPKSQAPVLDKLAELRALARSVTAGIKQSPSVRDSYLTIDPSPDKERRILLYQANIFHCEVNWGCFWQETPEDCVALYRQLLCSTAFSCFNDEFVSSAAHSDSRGLERPRLVAWNEEDYARVPVAWDMFIQELGSSTNQFLQTEAKLFKRCDASGLSENGLIKAYREYWQGIKSGRRNILAIEAQKKYLEENYPYDDFIFDETFRFQDYSKTQALKIHPLLTAHRSDVVAQINGLDAAIKKGVNDTYMADFNRRNDLKRELDSIDKLLKKLEAALDIPPTNQTGPAVAVAAIASLVSNNQMVLTPGIPSAEQAAVTGLVLVKQFFPLPQEQFWKDVFVWPDNKSAHGINNEEIWKHSWQNKMLVLGVKYSCSYAGTGYEGYHVGAIAILNPTTGHWEIILYPKHPAGSSHEVDSMTMFQGNVYLVDDELTIEEGNREGHHLSMLKYDRNKAGWETLKIQVPDAGGSLRLFEIGGHLFASTSESIFEITDEGRGLHILASTRRRPAASTLDSLDSLGSPLLYSGASNALCTIIANGVYTWEGTDWKKEFEADFKGHQEAFDDAILFRYVDSFPALHPQTLQILQKNPPSLALGLYQKATPPWRISSNGTQKPPEPPMQPLWPLPKKDFLVGTAMAYFKSDVYFFANHSQITGGEGHKIAVEQDGYHAKLICLSPDCPDPVVVPLKFDLQQGTLPVGELYEISGRPGDPGQPATWLLFTDNYLFIGEQHTRGVWMIPTSEIKTAVTAQKQAQLVKMAVEKARSLAATEQSKTALLAKCDLNHNARIDPDEREAAMDNPAFIESELDLIDTNHNGWLDSSELAHFDANNNQQLEPKEQAGIEIAQHQLALQLLKKFDADGDGKLDRTEFNEVLQTCLPDTGPPRPGMSGMSKPFPDDNHDAYVDVGELELFFKTQTRRTLRVRGGPDLFRLNQLRRGGNQPVEAGEIFKLAVETYWQNAGNTNRLPGRASFVPPGGQ